jgi:hypothetical protein
VAAFGGGLNKFKMVAIAMVTKVQNGHQIQKSSDLRWFRRSTLVSSTNKADRHDITGIMLKVALNRSMHQFVHSKKK